MLGAVGLLVLNDHLFKAIWPSALTGKVSDFAGALFFPILIQAALEIAQWLGGRYEGPNRLGLIAGVSITALLFLVSELSSEGASAIAGLASWLDPRDVGHTLTPDPSDLLALVMLAPSFLWGTARLAQTEQPTGPAAE
jgi:hypothetical protein